MLVNAGSNKCGVSLCVLFFFFSSRRRHTRLQGDWSSDVCSSDLRGILIMTPKAAMVLTGKRALDFSGSISAEDNLGIGGYGRIMGINGQGQYWADRKSVV